LRCIHKKIAVVQPHRKVTGSEGSADCHFSGVDCDDSNAGINPSAIEIPLDTIDQNCDGLDRCLDLNCDGWTDIAFANLKGSSYSTSSFICLGNGTRNGLSIDNRILLPTFGAKDVLVVGP
jgi:hypothetical protein